MSCKNINRLMAGFIAFSSFVSCMQNQDVRILPFTDKLVFSRTSKMVLSDDSLVAAFYWDTNEGGTAPAIESIVQFVCEDGSVMEESKPLLTIVHPEEDYNHHEVEKISMVLDEVGQRHYFFFLRAKVESNVYAHDIVAFKIEGSQLVPSDIRMEVECGTPHIHVVE